MRSFGVVELVLFTLVVGPGVSRATPPGDDIAIERAVKEIEKVKGVVVHDDSDTNPPITEVSFWKVSAVTDSVLRHLHCPSPNFGASSGVMLRLPTAGLIHLRNLKKLETLVVNDTRITNQGLEDFLQGLTE